MVTIDIDFFIMIFTSMFCGGIVGFERRQKGRPAGLRTSALVCMGTASFVYLSRSLGIDDREIYRVISAVVSGIGFLGAGVILNRRGHLSGVTSAAVIWALAAMGCFIGAGFYIESVVLTLMVLFLLVVVKRFEKNAKKYPDTNEES